jgi:hypothetical protein
VLLPLRLRLRSSTTRVCHRPHQLPNCYLHSEWYRNFEPVTIQALADLLLASDQGMIGSRDSVPVMRDAFQGHRYAFEDPTWVARFPTLSKRQITSF